MELTASAVKIRLQQFKARRVEELTSAFSAMRSQIDSLVTLDDALIEDNASLICDLATAQRLPSIGRLHVIQAGTLMGYGPDLAAATHEHLGEQNHQRCEARQVAG
jgi:ABC-type uncharacterized transport system substrate-binding protein